MNKDELKAKYARIATDRSQLEQFKNDLIDGNDISIVPAPAAEDAGKALVVDETGQLAYGEGGGGSGGGMVEILYADLVALRNNGQLAPGSLYRITDYMTTTAEANTQSAGHPFDVIVLALDASHLSEDAWAIQSARDTDGYFANSNLAAWRLKYALDNDTTRFAWADATNGKGVIYRMIDEFNNDLAYDFKNIMFVGQCDAFIKAYGRYYDAIMTRDEASDTYLPGGTKYFAFHFTIKNGPSASGTYYVTYPQISNDTIWYSISDNTATETTDVKTTVKSNITYGVAYYTFSNVFETVQDASLNHENYNINDNFIDKYIYSYSPGGHPVYIHDLNANIIVCEATEQNSLVCKNNHIEADSHDNIFRTAVHDNHICNSFTNNDIYNRFNHNFIEGSCINNQFGMNFAYNNIQVGCANNIIGSSFMHNNIGSDFQNNLVSDAITDDLKMQYCKFDDNVKYIKFIAPSTEGDYRFVQYVHVRLGVHGVSEYNRLTINLPAREINYETSYAMTGSNEVLL